MALCQLRIPAAAREHPGVPASPLSALPTPGPLPVTEQIPHLFLSSPFVFCGNATLLQSLSESPCERGREQKAARIPACRAFSSPISHEPLMPQEIGAD